MKIQFVTTGLLAMLVTITGCAVNSQKQMVQSGQKRLSAESLYKLVSGKNFHLTAIDFDAQVLFKENQKMTARNRVGETDTGRWDITSDDMVCLDFDRWYFGDLRC